MSLALRQRPPGPAAPGGQRRRAGAGRGGRGGGGVPARRAVVRWAWRLFRREWRQQVLVLALLTLAVAAAIFSAAAAYNVAPSRDGEFGTAERRMELRVASPEGLRADLAAIEASLGPIDVIGHRRVPVPGSVDTLDVRTQDPRGAYGGPLLALREGRHPTGALEVAVTDEVAGIFEVAVGGSFVLDGTTRTVVGLVENPGDLDDEFVLLAPSHDGAESVTVLVGTGGGTDGSGVSGARPSLGPLLPSGASFESQRRGQTEKATAAAVVLGLSTVVLLLVCLVAAAGFAVVAQRRVRQLGMLAAIGATDRHLRLVVLANGVVVGVTAAVAGAAIALAGWIALGARLEAAAGHRIDRFDVPWWSVGVGMGLAVATATAAAWWPARAAARIPITLALSARPPRPKPARRSAVAAGALLMAGFVGVAVGVDAAEKGGPLAFLLVVGVVSIVLGLIFVSPLAMRALAAAGGHLPIAARLALRDLARHQARSGAALAAISVGLGIAIATLLIAGAAVSSADEGNLSDRQILIRVGTAEPLIPDRTPAELERLRSAVDQLAAGPLEGADVVALDVAVNLADEEGRDGRLVRPAVVLGRPAGAHTTRDVGILFVATPELLAHLGLGPDATDGNTDVLTVHTGDVRLTNVSLKGQVDPYRPRLAPIDVPAYSSGPRSLITAEGLRRGGWSPARAGWLVETAKPLTGVQLAAARAMAADAGLTIEARNDQDDLATTRSGATAGGMLLALCILAMTVGLIRSEAGRDLQTLAATGATSTTRRTLTAVTAGALALLGAVLGIAAAYVAVAAGYFHELDRLARVPYLHLDVTLVGLPLVAATAGWLLAGREPPVLVRHALE